MYQTSLPFSSHSCCFQYFVPPTSFKVYILPFLLYFFLFYPLLLIIISLFFPVHLTNFDVHFASVSCMLYLSSLLQLFVLFEECGVSVHFCQLIHHFIPHVLCNTSFIFHYVYFIAPFFLFRAWNAIAGGLKLKSIRGPFFFIFISVHGLLYFHTK